MKTTVQRRLALLAGLLLLALIVFAIGIQSAQAAIMVGDGGGSRATSITTPTQPKGLTAAQIRHRDGGRSQPVSNVSAAQPASSGSSSRSAWIAGGSAAAVLLVGFASWALVRRRRQPAGFASATYCAQHPEDPLCRAA
jgi:hypothetical protein